MKSFNEISDMFNDYYIHVILGIKSFPGLSKKCSYLHINVIQCILEDCKCKHERWRDSVLMLDFIYDFAEDFEPCSSQHWPDISSH